MLKSRTDFDKFKTYSAKPNLSTVEQKEFDELRQTRVFGAIGKTEATKEGNIDEFALYAEEVSWLEEGSGFKEIPLVDQLDLTAIKKLGVAYYSHQTTLNWFAVKDYDPNWIMGKWFDFEKREVQNKKALVAKIQWARHQQAQMVKEMVDDGIVKFVSMGVFVRDAELSPAGDIAYLHCNVYEASITPMPQFLGAEKTDKKMTAQIKDMKPRLKEYRKNMMSDEIFSALGLEKTGDEIKDIQNFSDKIKQFTTKAEATPKPVETQPVVLTADDAEKLFG